MDSLRRCTVTMGDQQDNSLERHTGQLANVAAGLYGDYLIATGDPASGYAFKLGASGLEVVVHQTAVELRRRCEFLKRAFTARDSTQLEDPTAVDDLIQGASKLIGS